MKEKADASGRRHDVPGWQLWFDEPYRLFFPLGVLWSMLGVGFWLIRPWVPGLAAVHTGVHAFLQIYGFMGCFVLGFLGTAIPRFTDTPFLRPAEVLLLASCSLVSMAGLLLGLLPVAHLAFGLAIAALGAMLVPRFRRRQAPLPVTFVCLPFGLLAAVTGSALHAAQALGWTWCDVQVKVLASGLTFQGFLVLLILGVGGFLIRNLLTAGPAPAPAAATVAAGPGSGAMPPAFAWTTDLHVFVAVGIFVSFFLEAFWWRAGGAGLRALLVTAEALGQVRIWRWPTGGKLGAHWLRLGLWLLLAGLWADALVAGRFPLLRVAILHLAFIGGFGMVTLGIATRVVLSHTGHGALLQRQYRPFAVALTLLLAAAAARFGADFSPESFQRHLMYAAACWLIGIAIWSASVLRRVVAKPSQPG